MATKDTLTGLYDRNAFFELLSKQVVYANKYKTKIALLIVDIDRFYRINNVFGYELADKVLKKFSTLLENAVREQDTIARIGDNRFAIILTNIMNAGHAELAARKILRLLEVPFTCKDEKLYIDCTIAISLCPIHASNHLFLMKECESVLHEAKKNNKNIGISQVPEEDILSDSWDIELALEDILEQHQLLVYYQPQISLDSGRVVGVEALLRWNHPTKGYISPDYFIPIAERLGYIKPITNWILNTVLRHSSEWAHDCGSLSVSVNIPPDYILQPDLKDQVASAIKLWASDNIVLTLEIIERTLVAEPERSFSVLKELQDMGVNISLDDFGTGYSSLSYFEKLPVNELKIDRSFVSNILTKSSSQNIVKLIIELAHAFDLKVVAEGIEDAAAMEYLRKVNCDIAQGYHIATPMPQEQMKDWLLNYSDIT